jgi:hypothetical protein
MLPPDRAQTFDNAPIAELLQVLLHQLKRPLMAHGFTATDAEIEYLAQTRASGQIPERTPELLTPLRSVVSESQAVLAKLGFTFQQSIIADMDAVKGWETTAEFLELANEKSNAELRITLGSGLGLVFGTDMRFVPDVLFLAKGDYGDETVIARRCLCFSAGVDPHAADWLAQVEVWFSSL